jgi:hypothetical protein
MRIFRCPSCGDETTALAVEVAHHCPSNKRKLTQYVEIKKEKSNG